MSWTAWLIFVPACIGMNFFPGPNNMLALVNGTQSTAWRASIAGLARLPVMVVMIFLLAIGLDWLMAKGAVVLDWIRYIGAAYLIWMGWGAWRSASERIEFQQADNLAIGAMAWREAIIASTNPKLFLIFGAFFPQFIVAGIDPSIQIFWMGLTFVVIEIAAIAAYAFGGNTLKRWLAGERGGKLLKRGTGAALWSAAGLVLVK